MSDPFPRPFGRYELKQRLATGGMAELYLADIVGEHGFRKPVVIKLLLPHMAVEEHFRHMFIDEARLTSRLVHPKIAQTYELGTRDGRLYICMEWVDGIDVLSSLRECAHRGLKLPVEVSVFILCELLDALEYAHNVTDQSGEPLCIVHRDVSPSNVLLSRRGDVKLIDFGIARAVGNEHQTQSGVLKGKYGYMSPEQVVGNPLDARSDLFSAGILLAELLMGRRLFAAPNELDVLLMVRDANMARLDHFGADIPEDLRRIVDHALCKDRNARYPSASAFRSALSDWMFTNQMRVSTRNIADIVQALYDDVWARHTDGPAAARADIRITPLGESNGKAAVQHAVAVGGEIGGIPAGGFEGPDSMPMISVESSGAIPIVEAAPERAADDDKDDEIEAAVASLGEGEGDAVPMLVDDLMSGGIDTGASDGVPDKDAVAELSKRHGSIEEAVASLAPQAPDPSSTDYDEKPVASAPSARGKNRLPTAEEIKRVRRPQPPELAEIEGEPDRHGDLAVTPPIKVMYELWAERAEGLLLMSVGPVRKEIYLNRGTPEFVSSNLARELFGEFLVHEKAVSNGELAMALAMMPHYGGRLGDTLVGLGLMKPLDVFRMLHRQVRAKLVDVCTWEKGVFAYYAERKNQREAFPLDLNVADVVGAGAMLLPEVYVTDWARRHARERPRSKRNPLLKPADFRLGADIRSLYDNLSGGKTLAELRARYDDDEKRAQFLRSVFLLVHTSLVTLDA